MLTIAKEKRQTQWRQSAHYQATHLWETDAELWKSSHHERIPSRVWRKESVNQTFRLSLMCTSILSLTA